jgi:PAS domain S-box-containing protein
MPVRTETVTELEEQLRFQTLLAEISTKFINLAPEQVDSEIGKAQRLICEVFGLDRCTLWQKSENKPETYILTHVYQRSGNPPLLPGVSAGDFFPWIVRKALAGEPVVVSLRSELPPEASRDLEWLRIAGTKSFLTAPLSVGSGTALGGLSFDMMRRKRNWTEKSVGQLQLIAQVLANALARKHAEEALRKAQAFVNVSLESAKAGVWSVQFAPPEMWLSPQMRQLCGFSPYEEVSPERFLGLVHPDDREAVDLAVRQAFEMKKSFHIEHRVLLRGYTIWVEARGRFQPNLSGPSGRLTGISVDITERKLAEEAHRASEERFRALIEQAPIAIGIARNGKILDVNNKYLEVFGYQNVEELRGQPVIEQWAPQSREKIQNIINSHGQGQDFPSEFEETGLRKDGSEIAVHAIVNSFELSDGRAAMAFLRDVTQRNLTLEAKQRAEEQYQTIFNQAQEGICHLSPEGKVLAANPAMAKMLGYESPPEFMSIADAAHQIWMNPREYSCLMRLIEKHGFMTGHETRLLRKDRTPIWVSVSWRKVCGTDDRTLYYEVFSTDISGRKRVEEELRESEMRYRLLAENSTDVIWTTDMSGRFTYVSPSVERLRGFSVAEVMQQRLNEAFSPDSARTLRDTLEHLSTNGSLPPAGNRLELAQSRQDGSVIWTETDISIFCDHAGKAQGLLGHSRDITEKRMTRAGGQTPAGPVPASGSRDS